MGDGTYREYLERRIARFKLEEIQLNKRLKLVKEELALIQQCLNSDTLKEKLNKPVGAEN